MTNRDIIFTTATLCLFVGIVLGFGIGASVGSRVRPQLDGIATPNIPRNGGNAVLAETEARAESALSEIRTAYQGMTVVASFYGRPYHGRRAADGSIYDMTRDTVAHRSLPFGTIVVMENAKNGRLAIGRITDRGPYTEGRALDVSVAIAEALGMTADGLATLRIWTVRLPTGEMGHGRASEGD